MTDKLFEDDLFEDEEEIVEVPEDNPLAPFVAKYHDEKGIAKALIEKDNFIKRLQRETAELRTEVAGRSRVEEVVDRLLSQKNQQPAGNQTQPNADDAGNGNGSIKQGLTEEDVRSILDGERNKLIAEQNVKTAKTKLQELYGDEWPKVVAKKGKEIGESREFFDALARKNPSALLAILGSPEKKPGVPSMFDGTVNTTSAVLQSGESGTVRNYAYYNKLKAANPKDYMSPRVQNQMHKDAIAQGPSFFN